MESRVKLPESSLISVIIPVYNNVKDLERCLLSLVAQTFVDWVAICVDDGSSDGSGELLDVWAEKEPRIKVIHQRNGGSSSARNAGLDNAKSPYITMVDADDEIEPKMLETLYSAMATCPVDMVICGMKRIVCDKIRISLTSYDEGCHNAHPTHIFTWFTPGPVAKLFNRNIIEQFNIRFPLGVSIGEDYIFVATYWQYVKKVYAVNTPFYLYKDSHTSVCRKFSEGKLSNQIYVKTLKLNYIIYEIVRNNNRGVHSRLDWQKALLRNHLIEVDWTIADATHSKNVKKDLKKIASLYYIKLAEGLSAYDRLQVKYRHCVRRCYGLVRRYAGKMKRLFFIWICRSKSSI